MLNVTITLIFSGKREVLDVIFYIGPIFRLSARLASSGVQRETDRAITFKARRMNKSQAEE